MVGQLFESRDALNRGSTRSGKQERSSQRVDSSCAVSPLESDLSVADAEPSPANSLAPLVDSTQVGDAGGSCQSGRCMTASQTLASTPEGFDAIGFPLGAIVSGAESRLDFFRIEQVDVWRIGLDPQCLRAGRLDLPDVVGDRVRDAG